MAEMNAVDLWVEMLLCAIGATDASKVSKARASTPDNFFGNKEHLVSQRNRMAGTCMEFAFPNGFGASVICQCGSYGYDKSLWEIMLLKDGNLYYNDDFWDSIGNLSSMQVEEWLEKIKNYSKKNE